MGQLHRAASHPIQVLGAREIGDKHPKTLSGIETETLERRFDQAFGVTRSELERDDRLTQRMLQLERDLQKLGEAYALDDDLRSQIAYLEHFCRERGLDPWGATEQGS